MSVMGKEKSPSVLAHRADHKETTFNRSIPQVSHTEKIQSLELEELRRKYAHQLQRNNSLSIDTLEGHLDQTRVVNSRFLINQGIEPTTENLKKLQEETKAGILERERTHPLKPIERVSVKVANQGELITALTEEEVLWAREFDEILKILGQARWPWKHIKTIKRLFDEKNTGNSGTLWGSINVYELGRIHGIRQERERRKKRQAVNYKNAI